MKRLRLRAALTDGRSRRGGLTVRRPDQVVHVLVLVVDGELDRGVGWSR
eukprot:COSAG06_NODE_55639_length_288_cov_1.375661_1_plen_48_part_10